jgi:hypothetical protein
MGGTPHNLTRDAKPSITEQFGTGFRATINLKPSIEIWRI